MSLTAIVPVWNGREDLARLLASLESQSLPASHLVVVDNGSTDGAPELARQRGARVVAMGRNAGFAPAVNIGLRESRSEWIAVLNSDVELAPDYFAKLVGSGALFSTGKILTAGTRNRIDATFDAVSRGGAAARLGHGCLDGPRYAERRRIWSAPWTAAVFRTEVFERVGLLNEDFESYLEDVEFGIRCALLGVSGLYVPEAVAWHRGSATLGRWHPETVRLIARNQCYLVALHFPPQHAWRILIAQGLWGAVAVRHGAGRAWLRGKIQGARRAATLRRMGAALDRSVLNAVLTENERMILEFQRESGFDWYWGLYFLLTRGWMK